MDRTSKTKPCVRVARLLGKASTQDHLGAMPEGASAGIGLLRATLSFSAGAPGA
jgi:hypothetical protein